MSNPSNPAVAGSPGAAASAKPVPHLGRIDTIGYLIALDRVHRPILDVVVRRELDNVIGVGTLAASMQLTPDLWQTI